MSAASDKGDALQRDIRTFLLHRLPNDILWTADAAGVRVSIHVANKMRAQGVNRGWPDYRLLFLRDGVTRYIEAKAGTSSLSTPQRHFRDACKPFGTWALVRNLADLEWTLTRQWGVELKPEIGHGTKVDRSVFGF